MHSVGHNTCNGCYTIIRYNSTNKIKQDNYPQLSPPFSDAVIAAAAATQSTQVMSKLDSY